MLCIPLHLIRSEPGQKEEAKPTEILGRECSQGLAAMPSREVASLPSQMGSPMGRYGGRASPFRAKSVSSPHRRIRRAAHSVNGASALPARPAITSGKRNVHPTDEVPRRPDPHDQVSFSYKAHPKGSSHASEMRTSSSRPHPKGQQQRRSRGKSSRLTHWIGSERQNLNVLIGSSAFMGSVSSAVKATKWPEGTSSPQPALMLRNRPQQPGGTRSTVRQC